MGRGGDSNRDSGPELSNPANQAQSVQERHVEIRKDCIDPFGFQYTQSVPTVPNGNDLVSSFFEKIKELAAQDWFILCNNYLHFLSTFMERSTYMEIDIFHYFFPQN